jgi:hypothetical protein
MKSITQNSDGTITLTAPVMIPNAHDCDYENGETPLTENQIREFAKSYEKYQFIDHEHGLTRNGAKIGTPLNSFLLTEDTTMTTLDGSLKSYPRGSWFVTSQLTDPQAIELALSGGYTGYSASVFTKSRADEYLQALKSDASTELPCSCKDVSSSGNSLIKDVPDPVVLSVSLVKSPCLHDSKFCEVNGDIMENQDDVKSLKSKVLSAMGMSEEAEVVALKSQVVSLEEKIETMQSEFGEALKSMQEEFTKTLTEALTPVDDSEALKAEEEETEEEVEVEEEIEPTEEVEEVEETSEEEEVVAEKGESKAEPIHDNLEAQKSKKTNIYAIMGRNPDGTRKH